MRKLLKWGASALRVAACRIVNGGRLKISPGRPFYLGKGTLFGLNVCVCDHVFDADGVHADLKSALTSIGERCWIGVNAIVTRGSSVAGRICVGGPS